MTLHAPLLIVLLLWSFALPALAQGGGDADRDSDSPKDAPHSAGIVLDNYVVGDLTDMMEDEGEALEYVAVLEGSGDGIISERDVIALAEFTTWLFDRLVQQSDPSLTVGTRSAVMHSAEFWDYVWEGLDPDTKALISQMDIIFPAFRHVWDTSRGNERRQMEQAVIELVLAVWGEATVATASYLADEISYADYEPYLAALYNAWQAPASGGGGGSGSGDGGFDATLHDAVSTHLGNYIVYQ